MSSYIGGSVIAWSTAAHINQLNINFITITWSVLHIVHCLGKIHHTSAQGQDREAEWRWCVLCGAESCQCQRCCKRTEYLPDNPGTLQSWRIEGLTLSCFFCCVGKSNHLGSTSNSTSCYPFQTHMTIFCGCLCMTLPQTKYDHSNWPPSNIALTYPLCTTPAQQSVSSHVRIRLRNHNTLNHKLHLSPAGILLKWTNLWRLTYHPMLEDGNLTEEEKYINTNVLRFCSLLTNWYIVELHMFYSQRKNSSLVFGTGGSTTSRAVTNKKTNPKYHWTWTPPYRHYITLHFHISIRYLWQRSWAMCPSGGSLCHPSAWTRSQSQFWTNVEGEQQDQEASLEIHRRWRGTGKSGGNSVSQRPEEKRIKSRKTTM